MRRISALLVALLVLLVAAPSRAEAKSSPPSKRHAPHKKRARARAQPKRKPSRREADELGLRRDLIQQLQRNLIEGGYLSGDTDGALNPRTRRALVQFQREYHLPPTGYLDRATGEALLGHDVIATASSRE